MQNRKYLAALLMAFIFILSGCSSNNGFRDENGKNVSLQNKDVPTLVFFFTGNT